MDKFSIAIFNALSTSIKRLVDKPQIENNLDRTPTGSHVRENMPRFPLLFSRNKLLPGTRRRRSRDALSRIYECATGKRTIFSTCFYG